MGDVTVTVTDHLPPTGVTTKPPTAFRVPIVECDDTLLKTHVGPSHMYSMESADLTVPTHLQDLFDKSVAQGDLAPTHQGNLAALLRRHSDAFDATHGVLQRLGARHRHR